MKKTILVGLGLVLGLHTASAVRQNGSKAIALTDCEVKNIGKVKCGTLEVFENRATKKGRMVSLNIVVYPATGEKREPDPLVYFAGGPGSAATEDAPYVAQAFAKIREHRDLVFVDQRGTGRSHPLNCEFFNKSDLQSYLGYFFPLEDVRKCRAEL